MGGTLISSDKFEVVRVLDKRGSGKETQYQCLMKSVSDDKRFTKWIDSSNLNCPGLIDEYENKRTNGGASTSAAAVKADEPKEPAKRGRKRIEPFGNGRIPDKIIGATFSDSELKFLMKWKDTETADVVTAKQANVICPQIVIDFYESKLVWHNSKTSSE